MGRTHVGTFSRLYSVYRTIGLTSSFSRGAVWGVMNSRQQVFLNMTTTTFLHLILPTVSIVGNKRSKDESEKMNLWCVLGGEGVFMAFAFYNSTLFLIENWSSTIWISDSAAIETTELSSGTTKIFKHTKFLVPILLLVLCLSLSFHSSFDSRGPSYQSDSGCRVTTFNTQKEILLHSRICLGLF